MSMSPTKLTAEEHLRVFNERVVPESGINELESQERPRAIILAGQPGAGKSKIAAGALDDLGGKAVIIDTDAYRDAHPKVEEFRKDHPYNWGDDTHPDASGWAKELRAKAIIESKNIIIDTTLGDGPGAERLINDLKKSGYEVEVRAIATTKLESELGVDQRFTGSLERNGFGRFVPETVRSDIISNLPNNLDHVAEKTGVPVSIHNREGEKLYDSTQDASRTPGQALQEAWADRFRSPEILQGVAKGWETQHALHKTLPETLALNPKIDEQTAANLLRERDQNGVVPMVERMASASKDYLQQIQPQEPQAKAPSEQQGITVSPQVDDSPSKGGGGGIKM